MSYASTNFEKEFRSNERKNSLYSKENIDNLNHPDLNNAQQLLPLLRSFTDEEALHYVIYSAVMDFLMPVKGKEGHAQAKPEDEIIDICKDFDGTQRMNLLRFIRGMTKVKGDSGRETSAKQARELIHGLSHAGKNNLVIWLESELTRSLSEKLDCLLVCLTKREAAKQ